MRFAEKVHIFFYLLGFMFLVIATSLVGLQKWYAPFWNWQTILLKYLLQWMSLEDSVMLKKCGMPKKFLFLSPLALCFFGHYNLVCCPREILHTILELACHLKKYLFCAWCPMVAPSYFKNETTEYAVKKMLFFGIPHFLSMTESSRGINYNRYFNRIVCQF